MSEREGMAHFPIENKEDKRCKSCRHFLARTPQRMIFTPEGYCNKRYEQTRRWGSLFMGSAFACKYYDREGTK